MINRLIRFLVELPDLATSPLRTILDSTEAIEDAGGPIEIYTSHPKTALKEPYVILQKTTATPVPFVGALGTGGHGGLKSAALNVKVVAKGDGDDEADERAELLAEYVRTAFEQATTELSTNAVFTRSARGAAAGRTQKIQSIQVMPLNGPAPGGAVNEKQTAVVTFEVRVMISIS